MFISVNVTASKENYSKCKFYLKEVKIWFERVENMIWNGWTKRFVQIIFERVWPLPTVRRDLGGRIEDTETPSGENRWHRKDTEKPSEEQKDKRFADKLLLSIQIQLQTHGKIIFLKTHGQIVFV